MIRVAASFVEKATNLAWGNFVISSMRPSSFVAKERERLVHPDRLRYKELAYEEMNLIERCGKFFLQSIPDAKFSGIKNPDSSRPQFIWRADVPVTDQDVKKVFDQLVKKEQAVHVNTGTHGDSSGSNVHDSQDKFYADTGFLKEDIFLTWKEKNASFHIVSKDSKPTRPENANHIIDAWCYSANRSVREIKDQAEKHLQHNHSQVSQVTGRNSQNVAVQNSGNNTGSISATQNNSKNYTFVRGGAFLTSLCAGAAAVYYCSNDTDHELCTEIRSFLGLKKK